METFDNKNRPLIGQEAVITLGILTTIVILAGMVLIYIIFRNSDGTATPTSLPTPTATPIVFEWRELGYLTSVEFTSMTSVELRRERFGPFDETILLMAVGKIQTGIDMAQIKDSDVKVEGTTVEIVLPRAMVTSVEIIPGQTRIFDRGWFPGEGLETEALEQARVQLRDWAGTQGNLLDISEKLARSQLENFLRQLGFEEVRITFKERDL